jgi:hypothetical protein
MNDWLDGFCQADRLEYPHAFVVEVHCRGRL